MNTPEDKAYARIAQIDEPRLPAGRLYWDYYGMKVERYLLCLGIPRATKEGPKRG